MGYIKVKNVKGSSRWAAPDGYTSWLDYWSKHKGKALFCGAKDCLGSAEVGGHVVKVDSDDKSIYIVPLCKSCNPRTDEYYVLESKLLHIPSRL